MEDDAGGNLFPLEKVLTISAREYCEMRGVQLKDYNAVGVHHRAFIKGNYDGKNLWECIPVGTEAIVGYTSSISQSGESFVLFEAGTALIPKGLYAFI